jgi:hypothetical protein
MILGIILIVVIFINILLGVFVLTQNLKSLNNRLFSLLSFIAAIWTATNYMTGISPAVEWLNSSYALGSVVIATGLIWTSLITEKKLKLKEVFTISVFALIFFVCAFIPGFIASFHACEVKA